MYVILERSRVRSSDAVRVAGLVVTSKASCFLKLCRDSDCRWDMVGCGMQMGGDGLQLPALQGDAGDGGVLHENQRCGSAS